MPALTLEIICNDQGQEKPSQAKLQLYEQQLRSPYYVELKTAELSAYQLQKEHYELLANLGGRTAPNSTARFKLVGRSLVGSL